MPTNLSLKTIFQWPYFLTTPLLLVALGLSVFFIGTDSVLFAPAFVCVSLYALITLLPGFKNGWHIPRSNTFIFAIFLSDLFLDCAAMVDVPLYQYAVYIHIHDAAGVLCGDLIGAKA